MWDQLTDIASNADVIYIVMHRKADLDSAVSGYILYKLFTRFFKATNCYLVAPEGVSDDTAVFFPKRILNRVRFTDKVVCKGKCVMILVDVGGMETLSVYREILNFKGYKVLIDHHIPIEDFHSRFNTLFVDAESSSTLEIILSGLRNKVNFSRFFNKSEIKLMVYTLIAETRFMHLSNWKTLELLSFLLKLIGNRKLGEYYMMFSRKPSISERIAILKGFQRLKLYRYNEVLMGITSVSAFQNVVSSKLISAGLDVVIVYSEKKECKIHIRLSDRIRMKLDVVNDIVKIVRREFGGEGGGHAQLGDIVFSHKKCRIDMKIVISRIISILNRKGLSFTKL